MQHGTLPRSPKRRIAAFALVLASATSLIACGSSDGDPDETTTTSASVTTDTGPASTTTETTGTTTTTTTPAQSPDAALWPFEGAETFDDPIAVAEAFARDYLGFPAPKADEFRQGDLRSGEVPVRPKEASPLVTTVLVRQVDGGEDAPWSVIGATTTNLELTTPDSFAEVGSPLSLKGQSTAFEATVSYQIRADGSLDPIGEGTFMGGANGQMGPFTHDATFTVPDGVEAGAIVLLTHSAEDGTVQEAAVTRVTFA